MAKRAETPTVKLLREAGYKGFDAFLESKCRKPEIYAIQLIPKAVELIEANGIDAGTAVPKRSTIARKAAKMARVERRKRPYRVHAWLNAEDYSLLQQAFVASKHKTMQEFITAAVKSYAELLGKEENNAGEKKAAAGWRGAVLAALGRGGG